MSNVFKSDKLIYVFNKIIKFVIKKNKLSEHIDDQNKYVYEIAKNSNGRIINTYWVNPLEDDCLEKLNKYYELYRFKIIKAHQCWNDFSVLNKNFIAVVKWAREKRMPIFIHLKSKEEVLKFIDITNEFKEVVFIVAHMIGFNEISARSESSNLYFDLSAPQLYSFELLANAVNNLGSSKFIIGSDTPYGKDNIKINMERLKRLNLSKEELENILSKNIIEIINRVYKMETKRCIIQVLKQDDYEDVKKVYFDSRVRQFLGGVVSIERYNASFNEMINATDDSFYLVVRLKNTNDFIGLISIDEHHDGVYKELSYQFVPDFWGNGYALETIKEVINFASKELNLKEVVSETQVANKASCRLLTKLGMKVIDKLYRFNAEQYIFSLKL